MPRAQRSKKSDPMSKDSAKHVYKFTRADLDFLNNTILEPWGLSPEALAQTWNSYLRVHVRATEVFQREKTQTEQIYARYKDPSTRPQGVRNLDEIKQGVKRFGEGPTIDVAGIKNRIEYHHSWIVRELITVEDYYKANHNIFNALMIFDEYYLRQSLLQQPGQKAIVMRRVHQLEQDMLYEEVPHRVPGARRNVAQPVRIARFAQTGASGSAHGPLATPVETPNKISTPSARPISRDDAEALATDFTKLVRSSFLLNPSESVMDDEEEASDDKPDTWRVATCDFDKLEYGVVFTKTSSEPLLHDHDGLIGLLMMSTIR